MAATVIIPVSTLKRPRPHPDTEMTTTHSHSAVDAPRAPVSDGFIALAGDSPLGKRLHEALSRAGTPIRGYSNADAALADAALADAAFVIDASTAASGRANALHRLEHAIGPTATIVSIVSDETLGALGLQLHAPARLVGLSALALDEPLRFVEIVRGGSTSAEVLQKTGDLLDAGLVRAITVADAPGCHATRVARRYVNEGLALLGEGIAAQAIERTALEAGMSNPPLALLDLLSLEEADRLLHAAAGGHGHDEHGHHGHGHGHHHGHANEPAGGHERPDHEPRPHGMTTEAVYVLEKMAHGFSRMGRDAGRGFYDYEDGEAPELWSGLRVFERRRAAVSHDDLRDRLMFIQAIESLRCLDEGVVASAADANLCAVLGWGFPASSGGAIAFIDRMGVRAFAKRARDLAARFGERFEPPSLLMRHAERDEPFGGAAK